MDWNRVWPLLVGSLSCSCLLVDGGLPSDPTAPTGITATSGASATTTDATTEGGGSTVMAPPTGGSSESTSMGTSEASGTATTTGVTTNGTTANTTTTGTSDGTTGGQAEPQPADGLYADCTRKRCNVNLTDGCWELQDANMMKIDGFCTLFCSGSADCMPKPNVPAVAECLDSGGGQKVCALSCSAQSDCPVGMTCAEANINGVTEMLCW